MTPDDLIRIIGTVPAWTPRAAQLLTTAREKTGQVWPQHVGSPKELIRATKELDKYKRDCDNLFTRLAQIDAAPISHPQHPSLIGYAL